ncbi:MAG: hypothetical protein E7077_06820 [Bacteroidales bacterium]|jgi:hypothetical protein|nr:hypothetical protein [Bacteroidales bacterium]
MSKKLLLSMLFVYLSTLLSFGKTDDDPINLETFEIVVLPADTAMGEPNVVHPYKGSELNIYHIAKPKAGYDVDYWVSKKGLTLDSIADNDTIIVYYKEIPRYTITVISSDTTMGTVGTIHGGDEYLNEEKVYLEHYAKEGYKFCCWYSLIDSTKFDERFWAYRNDTIVGKFIAASDSCPMVYEPNYKLYDIVVLSADTTQGEAYRQMGTGPVLEGLPIIKEARPNPGYVFSHWYSVNGLSVDTVSGNDTIYAYFKKIETHYITVISEDTTKGTVDGSGEYKEGTNLEFLKFLTTPKRGYDFDRMESVKGHSEVVEDDTIYIYFKELPLYNITIISEDSTKGIVSGSGEYYEGENINFNVDTVQSGLYFEKFISVNKVTRSYLDQNNMTQWYVHGNDTLIAHFAQDTTNVYVRLDRVDCINFYGNIIKDRQFWSQKGDTIFVTHKNNGQKEIYIDKATLRLLKADTLLVEVRSNDGYISDSIYTITSDFPETNNNNFEKNMLEINMYKFKDTIDVEEAEGDSFNVYISSYNSSFVWEGNGRYAKGDTVFVPNYEFYYQPEEDTYYTLENSEYYTFVVKNDINIVLLQDYPIGVDQVAAEKENDPFVNVYTINGYLLKHHVKESEALEGLNRGIYIVGRKKVFVNK